MEKSCGINEFADRADLSLNLPTSAAVTLYMLCSFEDWPQAFAAVDEDPLSDEEIQSIDAAIRGMPVDPVRWNGVLQKLVAPWTYETAVYDEERACIDRLVEFSRVIGLEEEWAKGLRPGTFSKVLAFYMSLYHSNHALHWIDLFSRKYDIDIPFDMRDRLSKWKSAHPEIDARILRMLARRVKQGAV